MSPSPPQGSEPQSGRQALIERYEGLRRECLDRGTRGAREAWGLGVLMARGMAAWATTWTRCVEAAPAAAPPPSTPARLPPPRACEEVVRVLAGMVWALQKEGRA